MVQAEKYVDLSGRTYTLSELDERELAVVAALNAFADTNPDWTTFRNRWMTEVDNLYSPRGMQRREMVETIVYRVGQDLGSRLGISQGKLRRSDYRDELERLIQTKFKTRREFCVATGLSEDMLSHVLAKRKNLAIDTLAVALEKVGYAIHIVPQSSESIPF